MSVRVPIVRPSLGAAEEEAVLRVLRSGWITQGPEVAAFETELAQAVGARHAVAVANCTVGLELALRLVGVGAGDEVISVSHSFIATANAITSVGARPVFVDVDRATLGMDPDEIEAAVGPHTRAILCVHQIGMPCDIERIVAIGARLGLPVIEDTACAIGSEVRVNGEFARVGRPHGTVACFSFHPRKVVTTGDGGMLTMTDDALALRARRLRQHAMTVPDTVRHAAQVVTFEDYVEPAFNYRMTDLQAAVGRPQLGRLPAIIEERRRLAAVYQEALRNDPLFDAPVEPAHARSNWQSFPLFLRKGAHVSQRDVMQALLDRGIASKRGISNAHQEIAYRDPTTWRCKDSRCTRAPCSHLPRSEWLRDNTVLIPLFHGMSDAEQDAVIGSLRDISGARARA